MSYFFGATSMLIAVILSAILTLNPLETWFIQSRNALNPVLIMMELVCQAFIINSNALNLTLPC